MDTGVKVARFSDLRADLKEVGLFISFKTLLVSRNVIIHVYNDVIVERWSRIILIEVCKAGL